MTRGIRVSSGGMESSMQVARLSTYHDHKERMGHAGLLVMLGFVTAVLSSATVIPEWVKTLFGDRSGVAVAVVVACGWLLLHRFVRWQYANRRYAALATAGLMRALSCWADRPPVDCSLPIREDLVEYTAGSTKGSRRRARWVNVLWPVNVPVDWRAGDVPWSLYPRDIAASIADQHRDGTGGMGSERLVVTLSYLALLLLLLRMMAST